MSADDVKTEPERKVPKKKGRPTKYNETLAKKICLGLANGESLASICRGEGMPSKVTVLNWALDPKHEFFNRYERARALQVHSLVDEIPDIADDGSNDYYEKTDRDGNTYEAVDHENINRSKLRVQSRQWLAEKVLRRQYGSKVDHEVTGKDGEPVEMVVRLARPDELPEDPGRGE